MEIILCFVPIIIGFLTLTFLYKINIIHQLLALLFGLVAVLPISLVQYILPTLPFLENYPVVHTFLRSLLIYGFIEELFKTIFILPLPKKDYSAFEFMLLSFFLGLSLGCFESVVYLFDHIQIANNRGAQIMLAQIFTRILTTDLLHMACTGLCGLFIYTAKEKTPKIQFFVWAFLLHGLYDFFAGFTNSLKIFSLIVVLLSLAECRIKLLSLDPEKETEKIEDNTK